MPERHTSSGTVGSGGSESHRAEHDSAESARAGSAGAGSGGTGSGGASPGGATGDESGAARPADHALIEHADEIPGKAGESLREVLDQLPLYRELATIRCDCDLPFDVDDLAVRPADLDGLRELYTRLELASLIAARKRGLPVVLYTGDAAEFDAAELRRCGVSRLLRKPIDQQVLRSTIAGLLRPSAVR